MSLEGRYGPVREVPTATAAAQLDAYERAARAALARAEGTAAAPVTRLSDIQLAALFAPRQLDSLVTRPLARAASCGASGP